MTIRTMLVDDERIARNRLRRLLEPHAELEIVAECANGLDALQIAQETKPQLVFLDIQMPGMTGLEVAENLRGDPAPIIIFVTAYHEYALHAFDACALDYLLKPASPERAERAVQRALQHIANQVPTAAPASKPIGKRFLVRQGQRVLWVAPDEIDFIESDGNYAVLHTATQRYLLRETMAVLESTLPEDAFMRLNRSRIVRISQIRELETAGEGRHFAVLTSGVRIPITRSIREVQKKLGL